MRASTAALCLATCLASTGVSSTRLTVGRSAERLESSLQMSARSSGE